MESAKEITKFFQAYTKKYSGGAFSSPLPADIENAGEDMVAADDDWAVFYNRSSKELRRKSFTGRTYTIPPETLIAQHVARANNVLHTIDADVVYAYQEDFGLVQHLQELGYKLFAVRISSASELIGVYSQHDMPLAHEPEDIATLQQVHADYEIDEGSFQREVAGIDQYKDSYPYYNKDNAWGAACLRGYKPDDPWYEIKPAEMSKRWKDEHPEDTTLTECKDTVLAERCPTIMNFINRLPFGQELERVRLLRLKQGKLLRHCDITDRDLGTADGKLSRFFLPISCPPEARNISWDLNGMPISLNLKPWNLYYIDIRKPHAAENPTPHERIYLQIDVKSDQRVRELLV